MLRTTRTSSVRASVVLVLLLTGCARRTSLTSDAADLGTAPTFDSKGVEAGKEPASPASEYSTPQPTLLEGGTTTDDTLELVRVESNAKETSEGGPCVVEVVRLLSAQKARGSGVTSSSSNPAVRDRYRSLDHGVQHLRCQYQVRIQGAQFVYVHIPRVSYSQGSDLTLSQCGTTDTKKKAANEILSATHCREFGAAGPAGRLTPIEQPLPTVPAAPSPSQL